MRQKAFSKVTGLDHHLNLHIMSEYAAGMQVANEKTEPPYRTKARTHCLNIPSSEPFSERRGNPGWKAAARGESGAKRKKARAGRVTERKWSVPVP